MEEAFGGIPVITRALLVVNVAVHIIIFTLSLNLNTFSISAHLVIDDNEYYRIISAAFVHAGLMHIFMNMSSLLQLGLSLEAHFGSLQFLFLTLWSLFAVGGLYIFLAVLFSYVDPGQMYSSGVGYSGILFCYALIEAFHTTETSRSIFGMFTVPSRMYPFILLIILQIVIPNISFLGHGAGILVGLAVVYGGMNFILPSNDFLSYIETTPMFGPLTKAGGYVRTNNRSLFSGSGGSCYAVFKMVLECLGYAWNIISAVLHIVGCPVDRITQGISWTFARIRQMLDSLRAQSSGPSTDSSVELGNYVRVETSGDLEGARGTDGSSVKV